MSFMVRVASLFVLTLLVARAPAPMASASAADHRDGPALTTSGTVAVAHSRPHNPAPEPSACSLRATTLPNSGFWLSARREHAVEVSIKPALREHRGLARVHIPRRRIPRLRDDADGP